MNKNRYLAIVRVSQGGAEGWAHYFADRRLPDLDATFRTLKVNTNADQTSDVWLTIESPADCTSALTKWLHAFGSIYNVPVVSGGLVWWTVLEDSLRDAIVEQCCEACHAA